MGIFDIFSFKKDIQRVFSKENVSNLFLAAKEAIIYQVKFSFDGAKKKAAVDKEVIERLSKLTIGTKNSLVLWVIGQLEKLVPTITQFIYDALKAKIARL